MNTTHTLFLSLEKRINFTIEELKPTAKAYDFFRSLIGELNNNNDSDKSSSNNSNTKSFIGHRIPIDFPQYFKYERTKQLELWEIKYQ
jgi:hypothetical protein